MEDNINLIDGIIEDWNNLADYQDKQKDSKKLDKAWAEIVALIKKKVII